MSKPIDELVVQIRADTKRLQKDLKQIKGRLNATGAAGGAAFGGMAGSMTKAKGGALALIGALVGVGASVSKIAQVGMGFEDLRDSLNTVFGSIDAGDQAMQKILTFAQTTPFQIEDATKAFIALKSAGVEPSMDMLQTFADTASVSTDQLGAFQAMIRITQRAASGGLGMEELNMLMDRGIDVLGILRDELDLGKNDIAKFGSTADGANQIMAALIKGMEAKFGGAMASKMDNLSTKTSNMSIAFKGLADAVFTGGLGDRLKKLTDKLTGFANEAARTMRIANNQGSFSDLVGDTTGKTAKLPIEDKFKAVGDIVTKTRRDLNALNVKIAEYEDAGIPANLLYGDRQLLERDLMNAERLFEEFLDEITTKKENASKKSKDEPVINIIDDEQLKFLDQFNRLMDDSIPQIEKIEKMITQVKGLKGVKLESGELVASDDEIQRVLDHLGILKTELSETSDEVEGLTVEEQKLANAFSFVSSKVSSLIKETDQYTFANENLKQIFDENIDAFAVMGITSVPQLKKALEDAKEVTEEITDVFNDELKQAVINSSNAFTTDFVNSLLQGENALDSFKSFSQNIVSQIIAIFLQLAVVNKIINSIFNLTGDDALSTIDTLGSKTKTPTTSSGGGIGLNFAGGGKVNPNIPVVVGERGAEIFVPHTNGSILNNMNSKNAMGGGKSVNIYQTLNFATGIVPTVRAEVTKMMPQIADVTKAAVQESAIRGGSFRRSLVGG